MSIEGGAFKCYIHGFETMDVREWNDHCAVAEGHTEEGSTRCVMCDKELKFSNLPYHPFDEQGHKNISLTCPDCQPDMSQVHMEVVS